MAADDLSRPIPRTIDINGALAAATLVENSTTAAPRANELDTARTTLFFACWNQVTKQLSPPVISDGGTYIINSESARSRCLLFNQAIIQVEETSTGSSNDFADRLCEVPCWLPAQKAFMASCVARTHRLVHLSDATQKEGFCFAWFLPEEGESTDIHSHTLNAQRYTEELLGETKEHRSQISTTIRCPVPLTSIHRLATGIANFLAYAKVFCLIDNSSPSSAVPFVYRVLQELLTWITGLNFRRRLYLSPEAH